jgi:hypothetical protein
MPEIITRAQAKQLGLKRYFTNVRCRRKHLSARFVSNATCCGCALSRENSSRLAALPERQKAHWAEVEARQRAAIAERRARQSK